MEWWQSPSCAWLGGKGGFATARGAREPWQIGSLGVVARSPSCMGARQAVQPWRRRGAVPILRGSDGSLGVVARSPSRVGAMAALERWRGPPPGAMEALQWWGGPLRERREPAWPGHFWPGPGRLVRWAALLFALSIA